MIKLKNKKNIIIICITLLFVLFALTLLVNLKKLKANLYDDTLGFKDENLYNCVLVSAFGNMMSNEADYMELYNLMYDKYENFPNFDFYNYMYGNADEYALFLGMAKKMNLSLSKDDLKGITELYCGLDVKDYQGIELLESLEWLEISGNFDKLDLSKNEKLTNLRMEDGDNKKAIEIILPQNMQEIYIENFDIENFDISNSKNINKIEVRDSNFNNFSSSNETNIEELSLLSTNIDNFSFSTNSSFGSLSVSNSNIKNLDISKVKKISNFSVNGDIDKVDLSSIEEDISITIYSDVKEIKLPNNNVKLPNLSIKNKWIESLDLSNYDIGNLYIDAPNLKSLTFKQGVTIDSIKLLSANLENVDLSKINASTIAFNDSMSLRGGGRIKNLKVGDTFLNYLPNEVSKIYNDNGEYIEFIKDKVIYIDSYIIFMDNEVTIDDVINKNDYINRNGFELKICRNNTCGSNYEYTDITTKLQTIAESYVNFYKDDVLVYSYKLDVFDNDYINDYKLYRSILDTNYSSRYNTTFNLTEEELKQITKLNLYYELDDYSELKKLTGLKELDISDAKDISNDILLSMPLLERLRLSSAYINTLDISNMQNLKTLSVEYSDIENIIVKDNSKLEYLYVSSNNVKNIDLFKNDTNNSLKQINISSSEMENLDVSTLNKLEVLDISDCNFKEIDLSNNISLIDLDIANNKFTNLNIDNNINLEELDIENNNIVSINLKNNEKLEDVNLDYNKLVAVDFSNNNNLKYLDFINNKNLKSIKGTKNIPIEEVEIWNFPNLEMIDLTGSENIMALILFSNKLKTIDISDCKNLSMFFVVSNVLEEINGVDKAENLSSLIAPYSNIKQIDLSGAKNLQAVNLQFSSIAQDDLDLLAGDKIKLQYNLILPEQFNKEIYNSDDYIANYDEINDIVIANNIGHTVISSYFPSFHFYLENISKASIKTTVNVYDIKSSKFLINKEYKYIFNENNEANKVLNRYIKVYGEDVSKKIENNKLYMYSGKEKIFTFDILEITSDDYKIDNTKNIITYSGTFDVSKLNVINGTLNKIDNEVQLICNDSIVKTYKLEKK